MIVYHLKLTVILGFISHYFFLTSIKNEHNYEDKASQNKVECYFLKTEGIWIKPEIFICVILDWFFLYCISVLKQEITPAESVS